MADPKSSGSKRKAADGNEASGVEKKERSEVHRPEILWASTLRIAITSNIPARYKVLKNPSEVRFLYAKCREGPDSLGVFPREDSDSKPVWFTIHRKTDEEKAHRVVFEGTGSDSVEMTGRTEGSMFVIKGPRGFEIRVVAEPKPAAIVPDLQSQLQLAAIARKRGFELQIGYESKHEQARAQNPQLAAIAKERELIAQVLLIRKEYEETVLPQLPVSIQFTGAMVLGSLLPSVTVELRKGQLEDAEKQVLNQQ